MIEAKKLNKLDAKVAKLAHDTEEELQKEIRKKDRALRAAENKASKAAKSTAFRTRVAANKAKKAVVQLPKKAPAKTKAVPKAKNAIQLVYTEGLVGGSDLVSSRRRQRRIPKKLLE